jgi:hypothetical protein
MSKFTHAERNQIKNTVAILSIKRIPDLEILKAIFYQTKKTMTVRHLTRIKQQIKKESYHWYKTMREGQYEYIHEFKERINEILFLQRKHHQIIDNNEHNPQVQQTSLAELHRLSITLSNLFDVAPTIMNDITIPTPQQTKATTTETDFFIV